MANVVEATQGKIRDLPIKSALKTLLGAAGTDAGIDTVRVTSGGQCAKGTCSKRTGSTRHDLGNAADLQLIKDGRALDFTQANDLPIIRAFVTAATKRGATGVGAGIAYMGPKTLHIGFGTKAVWGAGGSTANAPQWLRDAAQAGWSASGAKSVLSAFESLDSDDAEEEADYEDSGSVIG